MTKRRLLRGEAVRKWRAPAVLGAVLLFHLLFNLWFLSADRTPLRDAASTNYLSAVRALARMPQVSLLGKAETLYMDTPDNLGPAFMAPFTLVSWLSGGSESVLAMVNLLFLATLLIALYGLGKEMFDEDTGLLAAVLITFYPPIFSLSRSLEGRLSLAALVTLALWGLVKSKQFSSRRYSVLFGLLTGLAALTKVEFSFFLAVPVLAESVPALARMIQARDRSAAKCVKNALLAALIVGTYLLGREMFDEEVGLIAAAFLPCYPVIFSLSRGILSRLTLTAMATFFL